MAIVVKGGTHATSAMRQPYRIREGWDKNGGQYQEHLYRGTEGEMREIKAIMEFSQLYDQTTLERNGALWELSGRTTSPQAVTGEQETPSTEIRLEPHRTAKDILEHEVFADATFAEMQGLRRILSAGGEIQATPSYLALHPEAEDVFNHALKGANHFYVYTQSLLVSKVASSVFEFTTNYDNVGRLLSSGTLAAETNLAGLIKFTLPDEPSPKAGFQYSWLKHRPSYSAHGRGYALSQEYEYGLWSTAIYGDLL